ncbi:MAG: FtsX-like permease family protein, partial [Actinobacteria bacterium]|nr:FtsX-like permease family protein [Actinomycetota bacterium]
ILISLGTVLVTSFRISRINIITAIRDLPEPKRLETRRRTFILGCVIAVLGVGLLVWGLQRESGWAGSLLGPPIALFGLLPLLGRWLNRRLAVILVALLSLGWGVFGDAITGGDIFGAGDIFAFVLQGILLNISAVVLLSQIQENLGAIMHRVAPRSLPLRLGMAYPLARRFRTGLTLGMFSLVIFTMVFISVLSNVFGGQIETTLAREAGGFEVIADSLVSNPPSVDAIASAEGVEAVAALSHGIARFQTAIVPEATPWTVSGIDNAFVAEGPPALEEFEKRFSREAEVWEELLADPSTAIVPTFFLVEGGGGPPVETVPLGGKITFINPVTGISEERTVIGFTSNDFTFSGAYMSNGSVKAVMGDLLSSSRFYIATEEGADPEAVAKRIQGDFIANGVEAESLRATVEEFQTGNLQFFRLMQGYLALGLLVGIAGIGVTMVRAVRERRREVGVMRSLGFLPAMVRRAFIIESGFTALEGVLVGTGLALITAYQLVDTGEFGEGIEFVIPWKDIVVLMATALIASLLATAWPAHQASRIPPAVALRVAD